MSTSTPSKSSPPSSPVAPQLESDSGFAIIRGNSTAIRLKTQSASAIIFRTAHVHLDAIQILPAK